MNYGIESFDASKLSFDINGKKYIVFNSFHRLFNGLLNYVAGHLDDGQGAGYLVDVLSNKKHDDEDEKDLAVSIVQGRVTLRIGYGEYKFRTFEGESLFAVYQHLGKPISNGCGTELMSTLVIFTEGDVNVLTKFLTKLIELTEQPEDGKFLCFKWSIQHEFWREEVRINTRSIESVVLPKKTKDKLITDVEKFLSHRTKDFYHRNGIPYRRSYLFYGIAGTGKTSLVQALASYFQRNLCYLMPTHPDITDDNLREAMNQLPENSIVIFEDIDALFTHRKKAMDSKSSLTFSGLLNALDGIGSPHGQIFILTTNLRDHLDDALIRNGRVDMHVEFTYAIEEQMEQMWKNFYPDAHDLAPKFSVAVKKSLRKQNLRVTTAGLQHFFITQMDSTAEEALGNVNVIVQEIKQNNTNKMLEELRKKEVDEEKEEGEKAEGDKKSNSNEQKSEKDTAVITATVLSADGGAAAAAEGKKKKKRIRKKKTEEKKNIPETSTGEGEKENNEKETPEETKETKEPSSPVLDENGEPKISYKERKRQRWEQLKEQRRLEREEKRRLKESQIEVKDNSVAESKDVESPSKENESRTGESAATTGEAK